MTVFRFKNVCIEGMGNFFPTEELSSAALEDSVAPVYQRLGIPFGTLERLTGVSNRRWWPASEPPSKVGTQAALIAIEDSGFEKEDIKALFSCSVSRDYFEPATGCLIHNNLGLGEDGIALDISNACLGFSDGMFFLANLIETGVVKAGIVVSGESIGRVVNSARDVMLRDPNITREQTIKLLPSFTLGCGAAAFVLCHESISKKKHKLLGGATRSATVHSDLCIGNVDIAVRESLDVIPVMETESSKLIGSAALLGQRAWKEASEVLGWTREDVDHIFCHQVGRQVNEAFYNIIGLDYAKEFTIYKEFGNLVSAAVPTALALGVKEKGIKKGEKIVLTGFGSGLNAMFTGIEW